MESDDREAAMSARSATRLASALAATSLALWASGEALALSVGRGKVAFLAIVLPMVIVFSAVGVLIVSRQPRNAIGWIFCGTGVAAGVSSLAHGYGEYWLHSGTGPDLLGKAVADYSNGSWIPIVLPCATFLLLLFPDGRLLSPRWRWVARAAAIGMVLAFVGSALIPGTIEDYPTVTNPFGSKTLSALLQAGGYTLLVIALIASPWSLILRFRRATADERQQIKWLALAGTVAVVTFFIAIAGYDFLGGSVSNAAILLTILGLPLTTGMAILRHRLYDIDVVINRTLVYGALTATLALIYLGTVLVLQLALSGVTSGSGFAVAASTLAAAALFRPARGRIQESVDRRFYRRKYDAARTLEQFGTRLRDEVDLATLNTELRAVVSRTLQPVHVSLWLRGPR